MRAGYTTISCAVWLTFAACSQGESTVLVPIEVRGALIDGSEDPSVVVVADATAQTSDLAPEVEPSEAPITETGPTTSEVAEPDALHAISFKDLSLEGEDVDTLLDYMLFPEDFPEGESYSFPERLKRFDGLRVTLKGYMIPTEWEEQSVTGFMLVRDLQACCFGGMPMPDEWVNVAMLDGEQAEYFQYLPVLVTGKLSLGGEQDDMGFALGVFQIAGEAVEKKF